MFSTLSFYFHLVVKQLIKLNQTKHNGASCPNQLYKSVWLSTKQTKKRCTLPFLNFGSSSKKCVLVKDEDEDKDEASFRQAKAITNVQEGTRCDGLGTEK